MNDNTNDNIYFFLKEKVVDKISSTEIDIQQLMDKFDEEEFIKEDELMLYNNIGYDSINNLKYFLTKNMYNNDEECYYLKFNVKELIAICGYYGIKLLKYKKQDIINTIIYFEKNPDNFQIVQQRNHMWAYMLELQNDPKMKRLIIFTENFQRN